MLLDRWDNGELFSLVVQNVDGTNKYRVSKSPLSTMGISVSSCPSWSPDGDWIAIGGSYEHSMSSEEDDAQILILRTDGSGEMRVISNRLGFDPEWSPDGNWIAFGTRDGLAIVSADGQQERFIPMNGVVTHPIWQP